MTGKHLDPECMRKPIVFGHYDILPSWVSLDPIGTLIFDEAHVLTNRSSRRTKAAFMLASRAKRIVALTGTPLWNKPVGLWALLALIAPAAFGTYYEFAHRYCDPQTTDHGTRFDGSSNEEELLKRLSAVMIRREWHKLLGQLPPVTRDLYIAAISPQEAFDIDLAAEALRDPTAMTNTAGLLARYRKVLGDVKCKAALEVSKTTLDRDEPVVLWTWHRSAAKQLHKTLLARKYESFLVTGDMSAEKREQTLIAWKQSKGALVITIAVGQVGIDLSHSRLAIFAEIDFTPALVAQAEMRTFAPTRNMHVTYVVADHDIDRRIIATLKSKLDAGDRIGVPAAEAAIDVLKAAFGLSPEAGDVDRLMRELLDSCYEDG
jgi:SWI/SNF-related matrix-associated actin-dependent regulator 1 of chromatin subfamily A